MIKVNPSVVAALLFTVFGDAGRVSAQVSVKCVKYESAGVAAWGILDGETTIRELSGSPISTAATPTGKHVSVSAVRFLPPAEAKKVIAAGHNYRSHIGQASPSKCHSGQIRMARD